ncbi:hypothetical protein [Streptosporangium roseum]|nr:hypothetical protein [Streptosporangium roseum]
MRGVQRLGSAPVTGYAKRVGTVRPRAATREDTARLSRRVTRVVT